jgi:hypothetical protein
LYDAEGDEHRKVRSKATERGAQHEDEKTAGVEKLAPHHVGKPAEDRQERRHRQQIGHRHPTHGAEPCPEIELESGQQHLRDAGIDLAHEGADAYRADDKPAIGFQARHGLGRRRLAAVANGRAQGSDRGRAGRVIHGGVSKAWKGGSCLS